MRVVLALALAGCTVELPPPKAPIARLPPIELPDDPPPAGFGRVVINTTDGPSRVDEILGEAYVPYRHGYNGRKVEVTRNLGTTPCVVDLPYGNHDLELSSLANDHEHDRVRYHFKSGETHGYVRRLGYHDPRSVQEQVGAALIGFGAAMAGASILTGTLQGRDWGLGLGIPGAVMLLIGIPLAATARSVEQPGAATWWKIEP
jgi:hypothetical protein